MLADCLAHAVELGAERLVDLATLTGAIVTALGDTYAGLFATTTTGRRRSARPARAGEIVWRLPLHAEYADSIKGKYARHRQRRREPPQGAPRSPPPSSSALRRRRAVGAPRHRRRRVGHRTGLRGKGGTGYGVRLLVELARSERAEAGRARLTRQRG